MLYQLSYLAAPRDASDNAGILCGSTPNGPSDRSLLDFTSVAIDAQGCPLYTFAGKPTGSPGNNTSAITSNYVTRQTSDCFTTRSAGGGSGSGSGASSGSGAGSGSGSGGAHGSSLGAIGGPKCPRPTGRLRGLSLGRLALGMTRSHARRVMPRFARTHNGFDNFCLRRGWGIRVGYPSVTLLRALPRGVRDPSRSRIVIALPRTATTR